MTDTADSSRKDELSGEEREGSGEEGGDSGEKSAVSSGHQSPEEQSLDKESSKDQSLEDEPPEDQSSETSTTAESEAATQQDELDIPADVQSYDKFSKIDGSTYDRANEFLRDRTYITAREWAMARLCADFRTETGVEMTKIGENLPHLVPFMTDTYSPQAVNQARSSFEEKVRKAGATFLYGAMSDFFTAEELDDVMYEATEVAKFLLEVEGVDLSVEDELAAEENITEVMREVREHSAALRHDEVTCPECGHQFDAEDS